MHNDVSTIPMNQDIISAIQNEDTEDKPPAYDTIVDLGIKI